MSYAPGTAELPKTDFAKEDGVNPTEKRQYSESQRKEMQEAAQPLIMELQQQAAEAVQRRKLTEERWLDDLRQFHGNYDGKTSAILQNDEHRSKIFLNITRPKTNAWAARLGDMLFPNDERNWGIDPTPVPELTEDAQAAVREAEAMDERAETAIGEHNAAIDAGQEPDPMHAEIAGKAAASAKRLRDHYGESQKVLEEARKRAAAMEREIDDQLTEARYPAMCRDVIMDAVKLGSGIFKGPVITSSSRKRWVQAGADGQQTSTFALQAGNDNVPTFRRVDPWHFFPDPDAAEVHEASYIFERHLPNKKKLREMARTLGFDQDAVKILLKEGPDQNNTGAASDLNFLTELRGLENDGDTGDTGQAAKHRYLIWEYYGTLENEDVAKMLRALGRYDDADRVDGEDPFDARMIRCFFCGNRLLKLEEDYLLDRGDFIYSVFPFEKAEASILGAVGVPHLIRHEQAMLNSAVRMMMDNAGLSVGPQVVIDKTQIEPEDGNWKLVPRKVWQWVKQAAGQKEAPFTTFNIPINQEQLAAIIQLALRFVDEAVSMPLIAQGEQGAHVTKTAGGMSMLFNSANVVFRRVVKNWDDDITEPTIRRAYDFNMQFSEKEAIKGDMTIEARGTSVLLVREMQAEQMLAIVEKFSTHPIIGVALKAYEAMRLVLQAMNINPADVLLEKEEYLEKLGQMAESDGEESASPEEIRAQTALEVARMDNDAKLRVSDNDMLIAQMRMRSEMMQLAQNREIKLEEIQAMFKTKELDAQVKIAAENTKAASAERKLAAEIGVERENARQARQAGMQPTGSGGTISMGAEE